MDTEQNIRRSSDALTVPDTLLARPEPARVERSIETSRGRQYDSQTSTAVNSRSNSADYSKPPTDSLKGLPLPSIQKAKDDAPYHVMSRKRKSMIVLWVSLAASFSPLSSNIYFPAIDFMAQDMRTDKSIFILSVSVFMIAQGIAPSFWGPLADVVGRRQVLIYTLLFYLGANIGLAFSYNFPMLMVFRFLQAVGSASTISIGAGVIADIAPPEERGGFIGMFSGVRQFAMAIGPVLGGLLADGLGYHGIFWFLVILSALAVIAIVLFLPETHRQIAGNGSVPLSGFLYQPLCEMIQSRKITHSEASPRFDRERITWRIFFEPMKFLLEKDVACTLFFGSVIYTVWSMVTSSTSTLLSEYYGLNVLQVGLCFLPNGCGCIIGSVLAGRQLNRDFRSTAQTYRFEKGLSPNFSLSKGNMPSDFPLEHARLAQLITLVPLFVFATFVYGMSTGASHLALPLVAQFVIGFSSTGVLNLNNTLTIDLYPGKGASATAVNNLARCIVGAVGVSLTELALERIGAHILFTILACAVMLSTVLSVAEWKYGMKWRAERTERLRLQKQAREEREPKV